MLSGKVMIIHLIPGLIKKAYLYKMSHFTDTYSHSKKKIKFELDFSYNFNEKA